MASQTVAKAKPGQRVRIARRLYEVGNLDGSLSYFADVELDGRQRRMKLSASSRTEARTAQANVTSDQSKGKLVAPNRLTVAEIAQEWLDGLDLKPRSLQAYEERVRKNIVPFLGSKRVQALRPKDCTAFLRWLRDERKLSSGSQTAVMTVLNLILKRAVIEDYIPANPLDRIDRKAPKAKKVPHRYLSPAEVARLLSHTNGYRTLFEVLAFSGLRYSEAAGLIWSDIDLTAGTINVEAQLARGEAKRVTTKNERLRLVVIDPDLVAVLKQHKEKALALGRAQPEAWVFQTADGRPYDYRNVWQVFQLAADRAKLNEQGRKLRIHDLRRTYASILLGAGQPAAYVAAQLGHTVAVLFAEYAGLIENLEGQHREQQLAAVAAFRSGAS